MNYLNDNLSLPDGTSQATAGPFGLARRPILRPEAAWGHAARNLALPRKLSERDYPLLLGKWERGRIGGAVRGRDAPATAGGTPAPHCAAN
jgi:hypothetical protein